jgi:hypothetical protein
MIAKFNDFEPETWVVKQGLVDADVSMQYI